MWHVSKMSSTVLVREPANLATPVSVRPARVGGRSPESDDDIIMHHPRLHQNDK